MDLRHVCCHSLPSHVRPMASFRLLHILGVGVFSPVWFYLDGVQLLLCIGRQVSSTKFEKRTSARNCGHIRSSIIHIAWICKRRTWIFLCMTKYPNFYISVRYASNTVQMRLSSYDKLFSSRLRRERSKSMY